MSSDPHPSYLIIGASVFSGSTALHLIRKYPQSTVTLVDKTFPYRAAASYDSIKIVRAHYANIFYMEKALEAMEIRRTDPLYSQFYHECGLIWVVSEGFARTTIENYERLGANERARVAGAAELRILYGAIFAKWRWKIARRY